MKTIQFYRTATQFLYVGQGSSTVVYHSPQHLKVKGYSPDTTSVFVILKSEVQVLLSLLAPGEVYSVFQGIISISFKCSGKCLADEKS
jgi:hypothetical protein